VSAGLDVLVTEPVMARFADTLTRDGTTPHRWTFAVGSAGPTVDQVRRSDVLVCSSASPNLLAAAERLRLLHVTGAGYDKVPLDSLSPDVVVANTFHHGRSIAEHVMMVSLMLLRRVLVSERDMRAGVWKNAMVDEGMPFGGTIAGLTVGIIGFGEIGMEVARLAQAMGLRSRTVRRNPHAPLPDDLRVDWVGGEGRLEELLAASDIVVVTVPLDERTRGLVGARALAAMKPSALLVNVARGAVVDEHALHQALSDRAIAGAALDVWWRNPGDPDAPPPSHLDFTGFDNVVITPHQSGHTRNTFLGRARDVADNVDALAAGRPLRNVVRGPGS